jgi:hypothetical protein
MAGGSAEGLGHQPILSHPKQTKAIAARLKNDRVDAQRLALLLRGDLLPTVWIPPAVLREARELIRHRIQLVWVRGRAPQPPGRHAGGAQPPANLEEELVRHAWAAGV